MSFLSYVVQDNDINMIADLYVVAAKTVMGQRIKSKAERRECPKACGPYEAFISFGCVIEMNNERQWSFQPEIE